MYNEIRQKKLEKRICDSIRTKISELEKDPVYAGFDTGKMQHRLIQKFHILKNLVIKEYPHPTIKGYAERVEQFISDYHSNIILKEITPEMILSGNTRSFTEPVEEVEKMSATSEMIREEASKSISKLVKQYSDSGAIPEVVNQLNECLINECNRAVDHILPNVIVNVDNIPRFVESIVNTAFTKFGKEHRKSTDSGIRLFDWKTAILVQSYLTCSPRDTINYVGELMSDEFVNEMNNVLKNGSITALNGTSNIVYGGRGGDQRVLIIDTKLTTLHDITPQNRKSFEVYHIRGDITCACPTIFEIIDIIRRFDVGYDMSQYEKKSESGNDMFGHRINNGQPNFRGGVLLR